MKLKKVSIYKYKCIEEKQSFDIENDISILVGMNESGKTSILEAIAKTNYFQEDKKFKFSTIHDYPRKEKKKLDKSGNNPHAINCIYVLPESLLMDIEKDVGKGVFVQKEVSRTIMYDNKGIWDNIRTDISKFIENKTIEFGISSKALNEKLLKIINVEGLESVISSYSDEQYITKLELLKKYFSNDWKWGSDPIGEYIAREYLKPNLPKFLYYDEYYTLPSRISIEKLQTDELNESELKTAKAFFELADINIDELINSTDFENYKAELEATEAIISEELFKYWSSNKNLDIIFDIDKIEKTDTNNNKQIIEHILDIRVKNQRTRVSLPLKNRSKGFNWFFSFLVWFKRIQEDTTSKYILLLDEPGLNLHASAQNDLLNFLEDLSIDYQIIYTTHSPFMISPEKLNRVRTVVETTKGSIISDSIQEKDPKTLFPLQAALGYDIAQNLFISKNNLLVEGVSDLIFLQSLSSVLESENRTGLKDDITIVPIGGLDKVSTFISLLRGSKLNIVCLLDSFNDPKSKEKVNDLIQQKIIHKRNIRFFDEFTPKLNKADLEDVFEKEEYLKLFNKAFTEYQDIEISDLNSNIDNIIIQINKHINKDRFNHYRPANQLVKDVLSASNFHKDTLIRFENIFKEINKLFN